MIDEAVFGFRVTAHFPPVGFFLNPHFEVPLIPVSQDYNPAYGALCLGLDQAAAGNLGNAAQYFKGVTDFCAHLEPVNSIAKHLENECTFASMAAHVHLGELALAWGDLESAADHLESARADLAQIKKTFGGVKRLPSPASITVLAARIDLARGDAATARARLSAIASKDHKPLTPDGYAVLAVAAARSGHADEAAHARQAARILGMVSSEGGAGDTVH